MLIIIHQVYYNIQVQGQQCLQICTESLHWIGQSVIVKMIKQPRQQESIVQVLSRLKDQLSDFNFVNIGNLTALTNNIQFLFSYVKNALLAILYHKDAIQAKLQRIELRIKQQGLLYLLEGEQTNNPNHRLIELNQKMRNAMFKKQPTIHRQRSNKNEMREQAPMKSTVSLKQKKEKTKYEYNRAKNFIQKYLKDKMEVEPTKTLQLPKNAILNLYLEWAKKNGSAIDYRYLSSIQMALTNQIKDCFRNCVQNSRSFKGIQFKEEFRHLMKTDVNLRREVQEKQIADESEQEDSPPLPSFDDDYKVQNRKV